MKKNRKWNKKSQMCIIDVKNGTKFRLLAKMKSRWKLEANKKKKIKSAKWYS